MATVREAGGVVVRFVEGAPHVLVVRARKNPEHWIFPKGHVEAGESPQEAAVREVREEAGVEGLPVAALGALEFAADGDTVHVDHFLLEFVRAIGGGEPREARWSTSDEALALLTFAGARELLRRAQPHIERLRKGRR